MRVILICVIVAGSVFMIWNTHRALRQWAEDRERRDLEGCIRRLYADPVAMAKAAYILPEHTQLIRHDWTSPTGATHTVLGYRPSRGRPAMVVPPELTFEDRLWIQRQLWEINHDYRIV